MPSRTSADNYRVRVAEPDSRHPLAEYLSSPCHLCAMAPGRRTGFTARAVPGGDHSQPGTPSRISAEKRGSSPAALARDRKSTRLNSSHVKISYAVFCLKKKNNQTTR